MTFGELTATMPDDTIYAVSDFFGKFHARGTRDTLREFDNNKIMLKCASCVDGGKMLVWIGGIEE